MRAGAQATGGVRRLDVDHEEEEDEEAEEASGDLGEDRKTEPEEEEDEAAARIPRFHRRDRPTTSWTGRPREFSW